METVAKPACTMTVRAGREAVLARDSKAARARQFWMYPSSETDGMWVVYATNLYYLRPGKALDYIDGSDWEIGEGLWIAAFDVWTSECLNAGLEMVETQIKREVIL